MHVPMNVKFINAKQVKDIHQCINIKRKLCKTNAAIWYNKTCRDKQITRKYISLRRNGKNRQCQKTLKTATPYRMNQEIKLLYIKIQLYYLSLQ